MSVRESKGHSRKGAVSFRSINPHCPSEVVGEFEVVVREAGKPTFSLKGP